MKSAYYCPHCDQKSTRRWNLETHIKRRHSGTGQPINNTPYAPMQSLGKPGNNLFGDIRKSSFPNTYDDLIDWQTLRKIKELYELRSFLAPSSLYGAQPMDVGFLDGRNTLGFKGYVCNKCFHFWCIQIFDDEKRIFPKYNHTCDPQKLHEAHQYTDIRATMHKKRQELISFITYIFNNMITQHELLDLIAVEVPSSVFENRSDSYEEYVDLDTFASGTPDWAYSAAKDSKTIINRTDLSEFLNIFEATLGFFRLTINGVKRYFFVYIANGLEPRDIKYLKKFPGADSLIATGISIAMNNSPMAKMHIPVFGLNKFSSFEVMNKSMNESVDHKMWDEISERQEYALLVPLIQAAKGEEVGVDVLKTAIVNSLDLAINKIGSDKQASYVFKNARAMINAPDSQGVESYAG